MSNTIVKEQLSLFPVAEVIVDSANDFLHAVQNNQINNVSLVWAKYREVQKGNTLTSIISLADLTMIPAWRNLCDSVIVKQIEQATTELFVKFYEGKVVKVAENVKDLMTNYEISALYPYWRIKN